MLHSKLSCLTSALAVTAAALLPACGTSDGPALPSASGDAGSSAAQGDSGVFAQPRAAEVPTGRGAALPAAYPGSDLRQSDAGFSKQLPSALPSFCSGVSNSTTSGRWVRVDGHAAEAVYHTLTRLPGGGALAVGGLQYGWKTGRVTLSEAWRYDSAQKRLVSAGRTKTPRHSHTATLLRDGRVLVVGGTDDSSELATTEIYDPKKPASQAWSAGPSLNRARKDHTATLLADGRVLVAGGRQGWQAGSYLSSLELYDPKLGRWRLLGAKLAHPREGHTATLLLDGTVLIAGGFADTKNLDSLELFDPKKEAVRSAGSLPKARSRHSATLLSSGDVLLAGGTCGRSCQNSYDDIYHSTTGKLSKIFQPSAYPPTGNDATLLCDGSVLVAGFGSPPYANVIRFRKNRWFSAPAMKSGRTSSRQLLLRDGSVLVVGGDSNAYYNDAVPAARFVP